MIQNGNLVQIHSNDEWNNLTGIVEKIQDGIVSIFCVMFPYWIYYANISDIQFGNKITKL